jgi:CBS domain-containing protein
MKIKELMTPKPACATPDMELSKVAKMMDDHKVGAIPVIETKDSLKVVGVVTDRDIATRAVAQGKNPLQMKAKDIMSTSVVTAKPDDDVQDVVQLMEKNMIRRIPVIDENGNICGMVAQADIALKSSDRMTANVVQSISKPTQKSSKV